MRSRRGVEVGRGARRGYRRADRLALRRVDSRLSVWWRSKVRTGCDD